MQPDSRRFPLETWYVFTRNVALTVPAVLPGWPAVRGRCQAARQSNRRTASGRWIVQENRRRHHGARRHAIRVQSQLYGSTGSRVTLAVDLLPRAVAEIVGDTLAVTTVRLTVNVALLAPAGTVRLPARSPRHVARQFDGHRSQHRGIELDRSPVTGCRR